MGPISVIPVDTTITQIAVQWAALTTGEQIGDAALTSYHLMWDKNSGGSTEEDWYDLVGYPIASLLKTFTVGTDVVGGQLY